MKKFSVASLSIAVAVAICLTFSAGTAESRPNYAKSWGIKYVKKDGTSDEDKAFVVVVENAKCSVCHEPGDNRKLRNRYGKALAEIIKPKDAADWKGEKDAKKIEEAFEKVAVIHIDVKDDKSPTYGDLIKQGKLPGGEVKPAEDKK
jgi:hypothetical protein